MRVQQSLTLHLEAEDVANLRHLLRVVPGSMLPGAPCPVVPYVPGETALDMASLALFAQKLARAVQGVS